MSSSKRKTPKSNKKKSSNVEITHPSNSHSSGYRPQMVLDDPMFSYTQNHYPIVTSNFIGYPSNFYHQPPQFPSNFFLQQYQLQQPPTQMQAQTHTTPPMQTQTQTPTPPETQSVPDTQFLSSQPRRLLDSDTEEDEEEEKQGQGQ